jgi:hypothetical protein
MLNVKTLTDTLSRMELPELHNYATLHKNDPYVVTMALSIANQKKQMKAGQAGRAGMMPQPKVADQQIAQMVAPPQQEAPAVDAMGNVTGYAGGGYLPEDQGIGQLPAPNMQGMAGGGIVAFDEGGDVPGYAGGVYVDPNELTAEDYQLLRPQGVSNLQAIQNFITPKAALENRRKYEQSKAAADAAKTAPAPTAPPVNYDPATATRRSMYVDKTAPPPSPPPSTGAPVAAAAVKPTAVSTLNTAPLTPEQSMTASQKFGDDSAITSGIDKLRTDAISTNAAIQKANTEGLAALPKSGTEAEARLKQREAQDVIGQADAKAMAIFKAGLGMMAGTSQNAFENIGKGAMAGLEDYSASIKDFRKLSIERDKAYADIEAARNAAARDDFKTSIGLQEKGADRLARAHEKGVDLTATIFKTNKETASVIYRSSFEQTQQNQRTQLEQTEQTKRAAIQANALSSEERILSNPALFNKKMDLVTAATGMRGDDALIAPYMKDPVALSLLEQTHPALAAQIKQRIQMRLLQPQTNPGNVNRP